MAVQWVAEEESSELSETLLLRDDLVAPELLQLEVANALRRMVWVGDISIGQAKAGLDFVRAKVRTSPLTPALLDRALELSHAMYHPIYDCIYLAVAEAESGLLITYDQELIDRAKEHGLAALIGSLPLDTP